MTPVASDSKPAPETEVHIAIDSPPRDAAAARTPSAVWVWFLPAIQLCAGLANDSQLPLAALALPLCWARALVLHPLTPWDWLFLYIGDFLSAPCTYCSELSSWAAVGDCAGRLQLRYMRILAACVMSITLTRLVILRPSQDQNTEPPGAEGSTAPGNGAAGAEYAHSTSPPPDCGWRTLFGLGALFLIPLGAAMLDLQVSWMVLYDVCYNAVVLFHVAYWGDLPFRGWVGILLPVPGFLYLLWGDIASQGPEFLEESFKGQKALAGLEICLHLYVFTWLAQMKQDSLPDADPPTATAEGSDPGETGVTIPAVCP